MTETMTTWELMVLVEQNFDAVMAIWTEMADDSTTLGQAAVEWAKRNGRDIQIVPSKLAFSEHDFHFRPTC